MTWLPGLAVWVTLLLGAGPSRPTAPRSALARARVRRLAVPRGPGTGAASPAPRGVRVAGWVGAAGCLAVLPWPAGLVAALIVVTVVPAVVARLEPTAQRRQAAALAAAFPLVADVFAALVLAGAPPARALRVVTEAFGGPVAARLDGVAAALELGAPAGQAWAGLATDPVLGAWASAMARTAHSGAPIAGVVAGLADQARSAAAAAAAQAAHRAGVWVVLPLGLCFLPAFVLLGVVPLIGSLVGTLLGPLT